MLGTRASETVPNKNVIQGMDLVYSQTKSGHPDVEILPKYFMKLHETSPAVARFSV